MIAVIVARKDEGDIHPSILGRIRGISDTAVRIRTTLEIRTKSRSKMLKNKIDY